MRKFNLNDDTVQKEALKACGYSKNQIEIYLKAKHNYYDVHYAFYDADGWLTLYLEDLKAEYGGTDPDEIESIGEKEFIKNKLLYEFGTANLNEIIAKIENGDVFADQLGGSWCEVCRIKVWVMEW